MGVQKNATYKVHNGTDFDEINFKTIMEQVKFPDGTSLLDFFNNGGKINGDLDLVKNGITSHFGYSSFTPVCSSWSVKGGIIETPVGMNLAVHPGQWSALLPFVNNDLSLGNEYYKFKDIWIGEFLKSPNGYTKLPNGFILQWGVVDAQHNNNIYYPIIFPNVALAVIASATGTSATAVNVNIAEKNYFKVYLSSAQNIRYIAIGY
ncbi:gp53-like domain-containing protein [Clostridium tertium]